jgi:hypothetical protein
MEDVLVGSSDANRLALPAGACCQCNDGTSGTHASESSAMNSILMLESL